LAFSDFKKLVDNRFKFGMFMLAKLPSAFICGVRVRHFEEDKVIVSLPYKWLSQNPFRSIYFACQAMAAEMSTGLLALGYTYQLDRHVSMLVTGIDAVFIKKAGERIYFTCKDGHAMQLVIQQAITTGEGQTFSATSIGATQSGEEVSRFTIEWSFKVKK
jgi:hypothetical protein